MLDLSAAFYMVEHDILQQKLSLYGFDSNSLAWINSYLSNRVQCVAIEGTVSDFLPVSIGVPQGSILGPLFYLLYTNELPALVHDSLDPNCTISCYADDTAYSCSNVDPLNLSAKLSHWYQNIADFMLNNRLKLNDEKTHLIVLGSNQVQNDQVELKTTPKLIRPSSNGKLLGCWINRDLKWTDHLRDNRESLIHGLTTRLSALRKLQKNANFKIRKQIANGIFTSK